jgi:peptidyl-tRNA hydrolase, PTH1 family
LIVGLGNPGSEFERTRHNVGTEIVAALCRRAGVALRRSKERAMLAVACLEGARVALAVPATYVNESGQPVRPLLARLGLAPDHLIVVYDDIDLGFGRLRIRFGGGTGGHQGLNNIVSHLHSKDFVRVRIGVGRPPGRMDPADFVLRRFSKAERETIDVLVEEAADAAVSVATQGVDAAMDRYNGPRA